MANFSFAHEYLTSSSCDLLSGNIVGSISESFTILGVDFLSFVQSLLVFLFFVLLFLCKLCTLAFPPIVTATQLCIEFHRTQLTPLEIGIELIVILASAGLILFRKKIQLFWKRLENVVAQKSKRAAQAAPHILFFGSAVVFAVVGQKFLVHLASPRLQPIFTLVIPILSTAYVRFIIPANKRPFYYHRKLSLWVVFASFHALSSFLSLIPFSKFLLSRILFVQETVVVIAVWIQLSSFFTDKVIELTSPFLIRMAAKVASVEMLDPVKQGLLFDFLIRLNYLTRQQVIFVRSLFQDGIMLLLAGMFVFTPFPSIGVVLVCLLIPAFQSLKALQGPKHADKQPKLKTIAQGTLKSNTIRSAVKSWITTRVRKSPFSTKGTDDNDHMDGEDITNEVDDIDHPIKLQRARWIEYWICMGVLWLLRVYMGISLWSSVMVLVGIWLQNSYLGGSSKLLSAWASTGKLLRDRELKHPLLMNSSPVSISSITSSATTSISATTSSSALEDIVGEEKVSSSLSTSTLDATDNTPVVVDDDNNDGMLSTNTVL